MYDQEHNDPQGFCTYVPVQGESIQMIGQPDVDEMRKGEALEIGGEGEKYSKGRSRNKTANHLGPPDHVQATPPVTREA